jgi:hypothetical protein
MRVRACIGTAGLTAGPPYFARIKARATESTTERSNALTEHVPN